MKTLAALVSSLLLDACQGDETVAAYGGSAKDWRLVEIDGAPFESLVTLSFTEPGKIAGQAPCNSYSSEMTAPYPWFETGPIVATRKACKDLPSEARFFAVLGKMTLSEVSGTTMILSNERGREMVFEADSTKTSGR